MVDATAQRDVKTRNAYSGAGVSFAWPFRLDPAPSAAALELSSRGGSIRLVEL